MLIQRVHPGYTVEPAGHGSLWEDTYPPDDVTYATIRPAPSWSGR